MAVSRLLLATLAGVTVGALAAAAALVLAPSGGDGPPPLPEAPPPERGEARDDRPAQPRPNRVRRTEAPAEGESLTKRFSSDDPAVRHAAALELLRGGDEALAQARAIRPTHAEGRALVARLVSSLQVLRAIRHGDDYDDLPEHERLAVFVKYASRVVPEELLRTERRAAWERKAEVDRSRCERGLAHDGEVALAELELLHVRWELGEVAEDAFESARQACAQRIEGWLAELRGDRRVAPARVRTIEERVARLTR